MTNDKLIEKFQDYWIALLVGGVSFLIMIPIVIGLAENATIEVYNASLASCVADDIRIGNTILWSNETYKVTEVTEWKYSGDVNIKLEK